MRFVGIDPGLDGAVAYIGPNYDVRCSLMPTIPKTKGRGKFMYNVKSMKLMLQTFYREPLDLYVGLEQQQAMPGQGVASMFSIGRGMGLWEGILTGLGVPYLVIHPRQWHREICRGLPGAAKEQSIQAAMTSFPMIDMRRSSRARVPHDGKADALNIAEYIRRIRLLVDTIDKKRF